MPTIEDGINEIKQFMSGANQEAVPAEVPADVTAQEEDPIARGVSEIANFKSQSQQPVDEISNPIFQQAVKQELDKPVNLPPSQDLMFAFTANKEGTVEYLKTQYPNSEVALDEEGNVRLDGKRVEAKTPSFDWLMQNAAYALNVGPQIVGSMVGGAGGAVAGAPGGPVGSVAGAMGGSVAGGTAGNVAGNSLRLAIGKVLGLSTDGEAFLQSTIDETRNAAIGEAISLGLPVAGTLAKTALKPGVKAAQAVMNKGKAEVARKSTEKALSFGQEMAKDMLKFVATADETTARRILQEGPRKVFSEANVNEQSFFNLARNVLFKDGDRISRLHDVALDAPSTRNGLSVGQEEIFSMLKENDNKAYRELVSAVGGLTDDEVTALATLETNKITPQMIDENALTRLSRKAVDIFDEQQNELGRIINKKVNEYAKSGSNEKFKLGSLADKIDGLLKKNGFIGGIKEEGFELKEAPTVPGTKELIELRDLFKGVKEKGADPLSVDIAGKKVSLESLSKRNAIKVDTFVKRLVESIETKETAPASVKNTAKQIYNAFREEYVEQLGIKKEVKQYAKFAELMDDLPQNRKQAENYMQSRIKSLPQSEGSAIEKTRFLEALSGVNPKVAEKFGKELTMYTAGNSLKRVSARKAMTFIAEGISKKGFLDPSVSTGNERIFKQVSDNMMKSSNPVIASRAFADQAMDSIAAREFTSKSQDLLRLTAMLGIIGIGGMTAGPLGMVGGYGAMMALQPRRIAGALQAADPMLRKIGIVGKKQELKEAAKTAAKKASSVKPKAKYSDRDKGVAILSSLLSRTVAPQITGQKTEKRQ